MHFKGRNLQPNFGFGELANVIVYKHISHMKQLARIFRFGYTNQASKRIVQQALADKYFLFDPDPFKIKFLITPTNKNLTFWHLCFLIYHLRSRNILSGYSMSIHSRALSLCGKIKSIQAKLLKTLILGVFSYNKN